MLLSLTKPAPRATSPIAGLVLFFTAIVAVQGVHVVEHVIQLVQVYVLDVPDDDAFGLLGYVFNFQGTEEWLHLVFNAAYLASLYIVFLLLWQGRLLMALPSWAVAVFVVLGLGLETWHVIEHVVIIANVIENSGCPCPGIGDRALNVSDTQLHFVYNAVAFAGTVALFVFARRLRPDTFETSA
jgi:hypothetical protein